MDPLTIGLITGGSSLLGSIFSSSTSASNTQAQIAAQQQMQQQTEAFNQQQAQQAEYYTQQNMASANAYNTEMSGTAYQRSVADMKAAGLNPMMMFGSGGPAASPSIGGPSGPQASVGTPSVPMSQKSSPLAGLGPAVQSGISAMVTGKTIDKMGEEIANLQARTATQEQETRYVGSKADQAGYDVTGSQAEAERAQRYINMPDWFKNAVEYGKYGASGVSGIADAIGSMVSSASGVGRLAKAMGSASPKSYQFGGPEFRQWMKDNQLGGRQPGQDGSFD